MTFHLSIFFLLLIVSIGFADHYKGGTISWKPVNPYSLVDPVPIIITERHSWTLTRYECNSTTISTFGVYNDTDNMKPATLVCISSSAACTASLYTTINSPLYCTDYSILLNVSTGTYTSQQNLAMNSTIDIAWRGAAWASQLLTNDWSLVAYMDLTPLSNNKINTSPVTASVPVMRVNVNQATVIQILAEDWDSEQVIRCRWSIQTPLDECGDVCLSLPGAVIATEDCAISWTPVLRSVDVANGQNQSLYVVAITAEDFENASSTVPLSSIPHQMLVQVYTPPTGSCATLPQIVSTPHTNQACFGMTAGSTYSFNIYGRVYCNGDSIVDFTTSSPLYMQRGNINVYGGAANTWYINFQYTPPSNQTGVQPFCVAAIDNNGQSTTQFCMAIAVGATGTTFAQPNFVQGTASPLGTVMSTQREFSIQANVPIKRPTRNGSQIRIYVASNSTLVWWVDSRYSPDVFYFNNTLVFYVRNYQWTLGETYCIVLLEGVGTADQYCGMESPGYGGTLFWRFTIWNPVWSSTTTPSTTTVISTTHTVTSRGMGTTTANTLFTTTGVAAYTALTVNTMTSTTSTSATTTTTTSATTVSTTTITTTVYIPDATVIYPKDMEQMCLEPVTIATALVTVATIPLHLFALITLFSKMNEHYQKKLLKQRNTRRIRFAKSSPNNEENQAFV